MNEIKLGSKWKNSTRIQVVEVRKVTFQFVRYYCPIQDKEFVRFGIDSFKNLYVPI